MAIAILIGIAVAVLPGIARSAVSVSPLGSLYLPYGFDSADEGMYAMGDHVAVEQLTYDAANYHVYTVGDAGFLYVIDISDPKNPTMVYRLQLPGGASDIDSCGNYVAVSVANDVEVLPGTVFIYEKYNTVTQEMSLHQQIPVGVSPDMLKFTKDCRTLVTCDEGEPGRDGSGNFVNPEGTATVITFPSADLLRGNARTATFQEFNSLEDDYRDRGLRWSPRIQVGSEFVTFNLSQSLLPESLTYNADESKAYVVLQDNNAIAVLDMASATFEEIYPLGSKYWGTSSLDTSKDDGGILMRDWPIYGLYQPDAIRTFSHNGRNLILTANQGGSQGTDEITGTELLQRSLLSPRLTSERLRRGLSSTSQLGCVVFSSLDGLDPLNPGKYSSLHTFGGRGFSVWDAEDLALVWDSEDSVEQLIGQNYPAVFNSYFDDGFLDNKPMDSFDESSCQEGPEVEYVEVGEVGGKTVFFVSNEKPSTIQVYSLPDDDVIEPVFQSIYWPGRADMTWRQAYQDRSVGDVDAEDLTFVSESDSPTSTPLLLLAGSESGTFSVYEVVGSPSVISASPHMAASWLVKTVSTVVVLCIYNNLY